MDKNLLITKIKKFPDTCGVYLMRDSRKRILYIGKATSLKRRVISYFQRPQEERLEQMLSQVNNIEIKKTDSVVEALFLESDLIKKYKPKYNIKLKDDKTFLGIFITSEDWPKVMPMRQSDYLKQCKKARPQRLSGQASDGGRGEFYGPYPSSQQVGEALQIIRKIFPFRYSCQPLSGKACLEYHMGLCPGVCTGKITMAEYQKTVKQIKLFLKGGKKTVILQLQKDMRKAAIDTEFEKAAKIRDRILALKHIHDVALIQEEDLQQTVIPVRIEAYDISNISGAFAVGSMVVFTEGLIDKNQYRKFKIKSIEGADDIGSLKEVLSRRLEHDEWPLPELIIVDGGKGQVNGMNEVLRSKKLDIPVLGIAKGPDRKKNEIIGTTDLDDKFLIRIRDEAHKFAIQYYRLRHRKSLK